MMCGKKRTCIRCAYQLYSKDRAVVGTHADGYLWVLVNRARQTDMAVCPYHFCSSNAAMLQDLHISWHRAQMETLTRVIQEMMFQWLRLLHFIYSV